LRKRVRRLRSIRSAAFFIGLALFAAVGIVALGWSALRRVPVGSRGLARRLAAAGLRFADAIYPGIVAVNPLSGHYCRVRGVTFPHRVRSRETFTVEVVLENIGYELWQGRGGAHPVRLGTWNTPDHPSAFHDAATWIQDNRAGEVSGEISPLGTAAFGMTFRAPAVPGVYREELAPVAEGLCWFPAKSIRIEVEVVG
jgi:hypothetical protein